MQLYCLLKVKSRLIKRLMLKIPTLKYFGMSRGIPNRHNITNDKTRHLSINAHSAGKLNTLK